MQLTSLEMQLTSEERADERTGLASSEWCDGAGYPAPRVDGSQPVLLRVSAARRKGRFRRIGTGVDMNSGGSTDGPKSQQFLAAGRGGLSAGTPSARNKSRLPIEPRMAPNWQWCAACNLPYRGASLTWFLVRMPDMQLYANHDFKRSLDCTMYDHDCSDVVSVSSDKAVALALRTGNTLLVFVGSTEPRSLTVALCVDAQLSGTYRARAFDNLRGAWSDAGSLDAKSLADGHTIELARGGFHLLELSQ